jgi:Uma2 family endonuclease
MGSQHAARIARTQRWLDHAAGDMLQVRVQLPLRLDPHSEPEPDLALVRPRADFYEADHPTAKDVLLLIEIADTTLRFDRQVKAPLYARSGIAELWIVDLKRRTVTVYRDPAPDGYRSIQTVRSAERIAVPGLDGIEIAVTDILG